MRRRYIVMLCGLWGVGSAALGTADDLPLQIVHPNLWPDTAQHSPITPEVERFVDDLLGKMTLEEKVGQMIQADIASISPNELERFPLGSVLAGGGAAPGNDLRSPPQAWLDLTHALHAAALLSTGGSSAHVPIPLLFGIDAVHGHAKLLGATIFPHNVGLGAAHDPALIRQIGAATAEEVAATGIDWTFAPTVAVARDVRWGRSYESYSESPQLVARYAPAMVTGLQGELGTPDFLTPDHTLSSIKHFLGDGGTHFGRDQGDTQVSEAELAQVHGAGYGPAIDAGAMIVMASYNSWNGVKMHMSHALLTDILKGRMGFKGFVVGDWNAQEQIPGCTKARCPTAILAGVDMLMAPDQWQAMYENTLAEVRSGEIPRSRIDDAARRILRVKAAAGLFAPARGAPPSLTVLGSSAHRAIARTAVRESLVLLKNERSTLPLNPHAQVLVTGPGADDIGMQSGGWTVDWQAIHNSPRDFPGATSIYGGIAAAVAQAGGSATLSHDGSFAQRPDVAIVVFGEGPYAEFQGDRENLEVTPDDAHELALLRHYRELNIPTVSVFLSGRPLWTNREINASDAFVAAWLPGSEGEGIADVLFKAADGSVPFDFTGRLSFSWPATAMPVRFDAAGKVSGALFARGAGQSYRTPATVPPLDENPRIAKYFDPPTGSLFDAGHVTAPWSLFVADRAAEVHVTTARQTSPGGSLDVHVTAQGVAAHWRGGERGKLRITGRAIDLSGAAAAGATLTLRYRVTQPPQAPVSLGIGCEEPQCPGAARAALVDVTGELRAAPVGAWRTLSLPLESLNGGAVLQSVTVPLSMETEGAFALTIATVRIQPRGAAPAEVAPGR